MAERDDTPSGGDEDLASALEAAGMNPDEIMQQIALLGGGGAPAGQPLSLAEILAGTSMAVSGRRGITGRDFSGILPPWASDLAPEALAHPDFDPYFGVVSQQGDERVYMGNRPAKKQAAGPKAMDPSLLVDPLVPGRSTLDDGLEGGELRAPTQEQRLLDMYVPGNTNVDVADMTDTDGRWGHAGWLPDGDDESGKGDGKSKTANPNDRTLTAAQVMNLPYTWSEEKITEVMKLMRKSGLNVTTFEQMGQAWGNLVNRASMIYSMSEGKKKVTPWDVLDMYKSEAKAAGSFTDYESGTKKTVHKTVSNITEGEAWASIQQTVSQMLGRDPSDQEVRDFAYRMNQLAAQNPTITETITKYKAGDATSASTTTDSGFSAADMAKSAYEKAQGDPDYAEYQSATTYFNAALTALGAIGDGG